MRLFKLGLAFLVGWLLVIAIGLCVGAAAQKGDNGPSIAGRIAALNERVKKLEHKAAFESLPKKVYAPFEVVDKSGRRIFYVSPQRDVEFLRDGKIVSEMSAGGDIGTFWVMSPNPDLNARLLGDRLIMTENGKTRLEIGRAADKGNYRLKIFNASGNELAGIGEDSESHTGVVLIGDSTGNNRAAMSARSGNGRFDVSGSDGKPVITLTKSRGGYLLICAAGGCGDPMVEAGDEGGYGVVRTGPNGYQPGVGLMGVPGSFIIGKQ